MTMTIFSGDTASSLILMRMGTLYMRILQDNELVEYGELVGYHNDKI